MSQEFSLLRGLEFMPLTEAVARKIHALPSDSPKALSAWRIFTNMKADKQQEVIGCLAFLSNREAA